MRHGQSVSLFVRIAAVVVLALGAIGAVVAAESDADAEQKAADARFLDVVLRIDNPDLLKSEAIAAKLKGVLDRSRGTEKFLEVVRKLNLKDRSGDLMAMAVKKPGEQIGANAARLALKFGATEVFTKVIEGKDQKKAAAAISVLGNAGDKQAYELLGKLVVDSSKSKARRSAAVMALGRSVFGQRQLLKLASEKKLADDLHLVAGAMLSASPDAKIRQEAAKHLKMPKGQGNKSLPSVGELVKRSGNPKNGPAVFKKAQCVTCHKLGNEGVEFGPSLAEIGSKLSKEALYVSILDPSAGVSFDFEGYQIVTADGLDLVGYIISETDDQIVLKRQGGLNTPIKKDDIIEKNKMTQSLMPTNLQATITTAELVDLIEYLTTLKKKTK